MKKTIAALIAVSLLAGCYRQELRTGSAAGAIEHSDTNVSFFWGLTSTETRATECATGVSSAESYWPWWGPVVALFTIGIVEPVRMEYVCAPTPLYQPQQPAPLAPGKS